MWPAFNRRHWYGRRASGLAEPPRRGAATSQMRSRSRTLPLIYVRKNGHTIKWREGSDEWLSSRFARVRVCVASGHEARSKPNKEWLLIEWPEGEDEPTKY